MSVSHDRFGLVGKPLADKYEVERTIDVTDVSVVYRATHRVFGHPVAIKALRIPPLNTQQRDVLLESFVREGALLTELSERCSAVCQARDVGSFVAPSGEWVPYLVLEWLEGETLQQVLQREREQSQPKRAIRAAIRLLDPVATALSLAHLRGIAHRDVKPGNIFLVAGERSEQSRSKILDFGVAKVMSEGYVGLDEVLGQSFTPGYGAPEQFAPEIGPSGPWTDVFALALIVAELITGRDPLTGRTIAECAACACDASARPTPRVLGVDVGDGVERVFTRALAVRPADRYPDARSFWDALASAVDYDDITLVIPLRQRPRPGPRWLAAAVLALALCLGVTRYSDVLREPWAALRSAVQFASDVVR